MFSYASVLPSFSQIRSHSGCEPGNRCPRQVLWPEMACYAEARSTFVGEGTAAAIAALRAPNKL
jgi:hypothetical protein